MSDTDGGNAWMNSLKVKPTALIGFAIAVAYPVLFLVLERFLGRHTPISARPLTRSCAASSSRWLSALWSPRA